MNRTTTAPLPIVWPQTVPAPLTALRDEEQRLRAEYREAVAARMAAQRDADRAPDADRQERAAATRERRALPEAGAVERARRALDAARAHEHGIATALWQVHDDLDVAVEACRDEWVAVLRREHHDAAATLARAVQQVGTAFAQVQQAAHGVALVRRFPRKSNAAAPEVQVEVAGTAVPLAHVLGALLDAAALAEPVTRTHAQDVEYAMAGAVASARRAGM
jgi:hypothetical protein